MIKGPNPDLVILFAVSKENARQRYIGRARDANDSMDKFERRYAEYEREGPPVEEAYREDGLLIEVRI